MPESSERGALTEAVYYILLSLFSPMHGYAIMQRVNELSSGRVVLGAGTLYGALNTMLEKGLIKSIGSGLGTSRKKEYIITDQGKISVENEMERLKELWQNGIEISSGTGGNNI